MTVVGVGDRIRRVHPLWWLGIGAIALRLVLFLGRGDYVAFDEGWYLVLGRNLMAGEGYSLSGLRHVALSPLFPIFAGALDVVLGDPVWAGRVVAALTGGLLVVPCWFLFRRLGGRRTALLGCALVAVMPSLAPFVVPFWIGWDLWVGAEPLLHLFLYSGIAFCIYALDGRGVLRWVLAGLAFGLAFLARSEALIVFALVALILMVTTAVQPRPRRAAGVLLCGLAFALVVAPYSLYLHDVLGRWTLSGRLVSSPISLQSIRVRPSTGTEPATARARGPRPIDDMLWSDDRTYERGLYSLDPEGTRLADGYWGVPRRRTHDAPADAASAARDDDVGKAAPGEGKNAQMPAAETAAGSPAAPASELVRPPSASPLTLYGRAMGRIIPLYLLPLSLVGLLLPRRRGFSRELLFALPLLAASILIAVVVAVDPRTQLLLVPLAAYYAARGVRAAGVYLARRVRGIGLRRRFATHVLSVAVVLVLFATDARRLYLSTTIGSPHHIVGAHNRRVGQELRHRLPPDAAVMSWHPALALFARRDWRVLPYAPLRDVVRYADLTGTEYLLLSAYYPGPLQPEQLPREYVLLRVPTGSTASPAWSLQVVDTAGPFLTAQLRPTSETLSGSAPRIPDRP